MKTKLFLVALISLTLNSVSFGQTTLAQESFESVSGDYGFTSNAGGTCSSVTKDFFFRVTSNPSTCFGANNLDATANGNAWFAGEDLDGYLGTNVNGHITLNPVNISGYSSLSVALALGISNDNGSRWEFTDHIYVQYNIDNGGWNTVGLFKGTGQFGGPLKVDTDNNDATNGPYSTTVSTSFQDFTFNIPSIGNSMQVRVLADIDGGSEEIGIDNIRVLGSLAVNNPPVLDNIEGTAVNYTEGDPATQVSNTITVTDSENDPITSATVEIFSGFESGADVLTFTPSAGISGSQTGNTLNLSGSATIAQYQTVLRSVKYSNSNTTNPSIATRTIRFQVSDGGNSNQVTRNINFTQTLNGPVALPTCESFETDGHGTRYYAYEYTSGNDFWTRHNNSGGKHPSHGEAITGQDGNWIWVGEDVVSNNPNPLNLGEMLLQPFTATGGSQFSIEIDVAVSDVAPLSWETSDYLLVQYKMDAGTWTTVGAFYGNTTGNLVDDANLDGVADPAGTALTSALQRFTYSFAALGTTLQVRILHSSNGTEEIGFDRICVNGNAGNNPPVLANIEGTSLNYTEGSGAQQVSNALTVSDAENDNILSGTVSILNGFDPTEDVLSFTSQFGITGSFVGNVLSLSGSATVGQYQTVLRSVMYNNTDGTDPSLQNRTITFQVTDGFNSNTLSRQVAINASLRAAQALPYCEGFETVGNGDRYQAYPFNDGSSNYWERHNATTGAHPNHGQAFTGYTGSYIWASEDVDEPTNPNPSSMGEMLLNPFVASTLDTFTISVDLAESTTSGTNRWEADDYLFIQYQMDGGGWNTVGAFYGNASKELQQDADLNGAADPAGSVLTTNFSTFTFGFQATGTTLEVRLVHDCDGQEEIGIDQICVTGMAPPPPPPPCIIISQFSTYPDTGNAIPHTVFFTDQSTNPDTWNWSFGDGSTASYQNPVHNYSAFGTYVVSLTVNDTVAICQDTYYDTVYVLQPQCNISAVTIGAQSACSNNMYSQDVTVTYSTAPGSGTLDVNGQPFAITGSPQTVTLTGLIADSNPVNVKAQFSADTACKLIQSALFTAPAPCTPATGLNFDGVDDLVQLSPMALTGPITIEAWVKPSSKNDFLTIFANKNGGFNTPGILFAINEFSTSNGKLIFETSGAAIISNVSVTFGVWQHVAVTYDGSVAKMYINGSEVTTSSVGPGVNLLGSNVPAVIGEIPVYFANSHFLGSMDELRIWSVGKTGAQIAANKDCALTGTENNLTAYYDFNTGWAGGNNAGFTTLTDMSVNSNNGSLMTFALSGPTSNWVEGANISGTCTSCTNPVSASIQAYGLKPIWGLTDPNTFYWGINQWKRLRVNKTGGVGPFTYNWSITGPGTLKNQHSGGAGIYLFEPLGPVRIYVDITDAGTGCTVTDSLDIAWDDQYFCGTFSPRTWYLTICENGITKCVPWSTAIAAIKAGNATIGDCIIPTKMDPSVISARLYPNPTKGLATFEFTSNEPSSGDLVVLDINGRIIQQKSIVVGTGTHHEIIDLHGLPNGMYIIRLSTEHAVITERLKVIK